MVDPQPLRPSGVEVVGAFVAVSIGGKEYRLPELSIGRNREWVKEYSAVLDRVVDGVGQPKTLDEVADVVSGYTDTFLEVLLAYDYSGVLPNREWIDANATGNEVYLAIRRVTDAAFPFGGNLLELALMQAAQKVRHSLRSTNGSAPPTAVTSRRPKVSKPA